MCLFCARNEERIDVNFLGRFFPSSCLSLHDEKRERFKFFYLQKTPINLFLSRPLVEREKKTKKDNDKHKGDEDLFFCLWVKQKKGRKNKKEKRIELPPPKRDYTYPKVRYYRHKSSSRSVAGAKTRKRRLFSGGVDFFAGFNRARL